MNIPFVIFGLIAFICCTGEVKSLICFSCKQNCEKPYPEEDCSKLMGEGDHKCATFTLQKEKEPEVEQKSCITASQASNLCETIKKDAESVGGKHRCNVCDSDKCNSAEIHSISFVLLMSVLFFLTKIV